MRTEGLKLIHAAVNKGNVPFLLLLFIISGACATRQSKNNDNTATEKGQVQLNFNADVQNGRLTIQRTGDTLNWQGETLAMVTWWDAHGKERSQAVSKANGWETKQQSVDNGYQLICIQPQSEISFQIDLITNGDILTVNVPSAGIKEEGEARFKSIRLLPCFGAAKEGDKGYLVIPRGVGFLCHFNGKKPAEHLLPVYGFNTGNMPLFGMVRDKSGFAGIITSGQFDGKLCVSTKWAFQGQYAVGPVFTLRSFVKENRLSDDLTVQYHFLAAKEATWLGIAKRYREYNAEYRQIQPLRDRVKNAPELAYSAQALEVRMRMGVKPVPTPVLEQTPENEPAIRVFLTYKKLRDIFDEFHKQGIDKSEFCVVGWHSGGHDGRFPQLFPVEEAFGGEEELRKAIAYGQSLGYQIVSHDLYDDSYRISKDWDEKNVRKKPDGQYVKGPKYAGGQSYKICRIPAYELFAKRDVPRVRELGFKGAHYNDVLSILGPTPCYDPMHPATLRQDAEASNKILALCKETFGAVQSEGPLDFTAPVLDRVLYITIHLAAISSEFVFDPLKKSSGIELPYVDEMVPLYPAVYHGTLLYNIWNDCVNTEPGNNFYLKNIEYGGMPVAYFYGHFWLDPTKNWLGDRDLHYDNKEGLQNAVAGLRHVYDDLQELKHLQMEFIEGHNQLAEGVFETVYGNGQSVVVNYTKNPFHISSGIVVESHGYLLLNNKTEAKKD